MKSTKTLFIAALAVGGLIACGSVRAQDSTTTNNAPTSGSSGSMTNSMPSRMRGPNIDRLAQRLGLNDEQKSQVEPIITQEYQKIRAVIQDTSLSRDEKRSQITDIRNSTSEQMKSILTPEQYDKWNAGQMMRMHHAAPPSQPGTTTTNAPSPSSP